MRNKITPTNSEHWETEDCRDVDLFHRTKELDGKFYKFLQNTLELNIFTLIASVLGGLSVYLFSLLPWEKDDVVALAQQNQTFYSEDSILIIWIFNFVSYNTL
jgi:hypothetical protein